MIDKLISPVTDWVARRSVRQQRDSSLWNPDLWGADIDSAGHLTLDEFDVCNALAEYGSPTMLVSHSRLRHDIHQFMAAAEAAFDDVFIAFSYKTNAVSGVLEHIHAGGMGAEVISPYGIMARRKTGRPR